MIAFLGSMSVLATSLVFLGGALFHGSTQLGIVLAALGGGWLGILYGGLLRLAATRITERP